MSHMCEKTLRFVLSDSNFNFKSIYLQNINVNETAPNFTYSQKW